MHGDLSNNVKPTRRCAEQTDVVPPRDGESPLGMYKLEQADPKDCAALVMWEQSTTGSGVQVFIISKSNCPMSNFYQLKYAATIDLHKLFSFCPFFERAQM